MILIFPGNHIGNRALANGKQHDPEYLYKLYWIDKLTIKEITLVLGLSENSSSYVLGLMKRYGVPTKSKSDWNKERWLRGDFDLAFRDATKPEIKVRNTLIVLGIAFKEQHRPDGCTYTFDFFVSPNLMIEVQGDYWHSRPEVVERDAKKRKWVMDNGFRFLEFWEKDIMSDSIEWIRRLRAWQD